MSARTARKRTAAPEWRSQAASAMVLARRLVDEPDLDVAEVAGVLRFALTRCCAAYLDAVGGLPEPNDPSGFISALYNEAPPAVGLKVATVVRKLRSLEVAAPYEPAAPGERWTLKEVRCELRAIAGELRHLAVYTTARHDMPEFRGEDAGVITEGAWVRHYDRDWGGGATRLGKVVGVDSPRVFVRFRETGVEALDLSLALLQATGRRPEPVTDREARRTWFDLLLARTPGLRPTRDPDRLFGSRTAEYVYTCSCCGYPTRRVRLPQWRLVGMRSPASEPRCALCDWADGEGQDDEDAAEVLGGMNGPYSLLQARAAFEAGGSMYPPTAEGERAAWHRSNSIVKAKRGVRSLFEGVRRAGYEDPAAYTAWRAACERLERLPRLAAAPDVRRIRPIVSPTRGRIAGALGRRPGA